MTHVVTKQFAHFTTFIRAGTINLKSEKTFMHVLFQKEKKIQLSLCRLNHSPSANGRGIFLYNIRTRFLILILILKMFLLLQLISVGLS